MEARALTAEDDDEIAGEVELVVVDGAALVETDDPEVVALELFEGADEVDDAGDAEVLGGAGAGFDGRGAEGCGAALGEENAVDAGAIRNAEERAEVLRVFDAVEGEDEASGGFACGGTGREEVFEGKEFLRTDERHYALVRGGFGSEGELLARLVADTNAGLDGIGRRDGRCASHGGRHGARGRRERGQSGACRP